MMALTTYTLPICGQRLVSASQRKTFSKAAHRQKSSRYIANMRWAILYFAIPDPEERVASPRLARSRAEPRSLALAWAAGRGRAIPGLLITTASPTLILRTA